MYRSGKEFERLNKHLPWTSFAAISGVNVLSSKFLNACFMIFIINIQIVLQIVNTLNNFKIAPKYNYKCLLLRKSFIGSLVFDVAFVLFLLKYK